MFKVGDRIVCINNERCTNLSVGKIYTIRLDSGSDDMVCVDNNFLSNSNYYNHRFISLKEYRKRKLNKICSESEIY